MARPKIILDDEIKDVHAWMGIRLWQKIANVAHRRGKGVGVSTIIREILEKEFDGQEG